MSRPRKNIMPKAHRLLAEQAIEVLERALDAFDDPTTDEKTVQEISRVVTRTYHRWMRIQARKRASKEPATRDVRDETH